MNSNNLSLFVPIALVFPTFAADYLSEGQAQKILFPAATEMVPKSISLSDDQIQKIKELSGVRQREKSPKIWHALEKGKALGWFLIDEVVGKHEYITYAIAITVDGKVLGIEIMSYRETHGGEVREDSWRKTFKGKTLADPFKLDKDVPNITGATLSCRSLLDGVKRLLSMHQVLVGEKIL